MKIKGGWASITGAWPPLSFMSQNLLKKRLEFYDHLISAASYLADELTTRLDKFKPLLGAPPGSHDFDSLKAEYIILRHARDVAEDLRRKAFFLRSGGRGCPERLERDFTTLEMMEQEFEKELPHFTDSWKMQLPGN